MTGQRTAETELLKFWAYTPTADFPAQMQKNIRDFVKSVIATGQEPSFPPRSVALSSLLLYLRKVTGFSDTLTNDAQAMLNAALVEEGLRQLNDSINTDIGKFAAHEIANYGIATSKKPRPIDTPTHDSLASKFESYFRSYKPFTSDDAMYGAADAQIAVRLIEAKIPLFCDALEKAKTASADYATADQNYRRSLGKIGASLLTGKRVQETAEALLPSLTTALETNECLHQNLGSYHFPKLSDIAAIVNASAAGRPGGNSFYRSG